MRAFLFAFFLITYSLISNGQVIAGHAHAVYFGKPAYLYTYTDAISKHKVLADSCTVKPDGSFHFNFKTDKIVEALISIDRVNGGLFLEPGAHYKVYFSNLAPGQTKTMNNSNIINLEFDQLPKTDINQLITNFNQKFDVFFDSEIANVFDRGFSKTLDTFHKLCDSTFASYKNAFLNQYIHFCFANFELNSGTYRKALFEKYLAHQKTDLHNPEYGNFMIQFFADELNRFDRFSKAKPLTAAITKGNVTEFLENLRNNDFLKNNEQLRETTTLVILMEEYRKKQAKKTALIKMIDDLAKLSTHPPVKALAHHIKLELTRLETGYSAYPFKLKTRDGKLVKLESFAGKPTYIMITTGKSTESILEMSLIKSLFQKYGKQINFLIIGIEDQEEEFARNFINGPGMPLSVNYSNDKFLIEQLDISFLPKFILLDKSGHYLNYNAPAPSRNLEAVLEGLLPKN